MLKVMTTVGTRPEIIKLSRVFVEMPKTKDSGQFSFFMVVMLWANEIFDRSRPDTIPCKV